VYHDTTSHAEACLEISIFIEGWYNTRRRYSSLDYLSPMEYERRYNLEVFTPSPYQDAKTG
jgi:transposase InsO family protein